ncbi:MAG: YdgA family protein [Azoarcus sp.]|jgi:uncharacterized protein YdgA (DUF945 family)|nr:YdgA family protein [Azoarcus sp.]
MSGTATKVIGALVALVVVLCIGSFWVGAWVEQAFSESVARTTRYGFTMKVVDYQRGLFGATARSEVVLPKSLGKESSLFFDHDIQHGPLPILFGAARIHSRLTALPDEYARIFEGDPFAGKTVIEVETTVGWGGGLHHRFNSPGFEAKGREGQKIVWGGFDGEIDTDSNQTRFRTKLHFAGLSGEGFQVGEVLLDNNLAWDDEFGQASGTSNLTLEKFVYSSKNADNSTFAVDMGKSRAETEISVGDEGAPKTKTDLTVTKIAVTEGDVAQTIDDIKLALLTENIDIGAVIEAVSVDQDENADIALLDAMSQAAREQTEEENAGGTRPPASQPPAAANDKEGAETAADAGDESAFMTALLQRKPTLSIEDFRAHWREGEVTGLFRIGYVGDASPGCGGGAAAALGDTDLFTGLFSKANYTVELHLPRAVAVDLLTSTNVDAEDSEAGDLAKQSITEMLQDGLLVEKNGVLNLAVSSENCVRNLNGKPFVDDAVLLKLWGLWPFSSDADQPSGNEEDGAADGG